MPVIAATPSVLTACLTCYSLFDLLENKLRATGGESYPPFNVERLGENAYRITLAVAGFRSTDVEITAQRNLLTIKGRRPEDAQGRATVLHVGISQRGFERRFELADFVRVENASLDHGLLVINLVREMPETMKPHMISIGDTQQLSVVETKGSNKGSNQAA